LTIGGLRWRQGITTTSARGPIVVLRWMGDRRELLVAGVDSREDGLLEVEVVLPVYHPDVVTLSLCSPV